MIIDWPDDLLKIRSENWHLSGATLSAGGVFGPGTVIHMENRVWKYTLDLVHLMPDELARARVILDELRGQYGVLRIGAPGAGARPEFSKSDVTFDSGVTFDDGAAFSAKGSGLRASSNAPKGATLLQMPNASILSPASHISIADKLYRVFSVDGQNVKINPPLRNAVKAGDLVEAENPRALMRLTVDDAAMSRILGGFGAPTAYDLSEAFT